MGVAMYRFDESGNPIRVRGIRHKEMEFIRDRTVKFASYQGYQTWGGSYPASPVLTSDYTYQSIILRPDGEVWLWVGNVLEYMTVKPGDEIRYPFGVGKSYVLTSGIWVSSTKYSRWDVTEFLEANYDIYTAIEYGGALYFSATRPPYIGFTRCNL